MLLPGVVPTGHAMQGACWCCRGPSCRAAPPSCWRCSACTSAPAAATGEAWSLPLHEVPIDWWCGLGGPAQSRWLARSRPLPHVCSLLMHPDAHPARFLVEASLELRGTLRLPGVCPSQRDKPCKGTTFQPVDGTQVWLTPTAPMRELRASIPSAIRFVWRL